MNLRMFTRSCFLRRLSVTAGLTLCGAAMSFGQGGPQPPGGEPLVPIDPKVLAKAQEDTGKEMAAVQQRVKKLSAVEYELDGIHINAATREIRIPTVVNLKKAPIEYALVHETGKTHESILATAIQPMSIQVALLLANYQAATEGLLTKVPEADRPKWKEEAPAKPKANRLVMKVEWKAGAETKSAPLADWVQDSDHRRVPPDLGTWIFNGSRIDDRGFTAQAEGSIISVWIDRNAIINSPAEGNWRDDLWLSMPQNVPEEGTAVTLIISPEAAAAPASPSAPATPVPPSTKP